MELRSNHHLHYISAVKGGKVVKIPNVTRDRPTLSFKDINTILGSPELYDGSNTKDIALVNRSLQKVSGLNMVKSEVEIASDNCITDSSDERSHDLDDIFLGEMTLKQLKKKCKAQKWEGSRSVDKEVNKKYGGSEPEEDGFDLEETLGSLKRKVSRKSKSRKMQKCGSGSKPTVVVKCEPVSFDQDSLQVGGAIDMCATIKMEISEPDSSLYNDVSCFSDDSYPSEHGMIPTGEIVGETQVTSESCMEEEDSLIIAQGPEVSKAGPASCEHLTTADSPPEIPASSEHLTTADSPPEIPACEEMMNVDDQGMIENVASELPGPDDGCSPGEQSSLIVEEHQVCSLNQISYEFNEHLEGSCVPPESSSHESELPDPDDGCSPREQSSLIAEELQVCSLNRTSYEFKDNLEDSCVSPERSNHKEALKADDPIKAADQPISNPILAQEDEDITDALACNESPDFLFPLYGSSCSENHMSLQDEDITCSNKECMLPGFPCTSVNSPTSGLDATIRCTNPLKHVNEAVPSDRGRPVMVEVDSMDDTDKVSRSLSSESIESFELQHPPERLLSARKTISPDSQQKLRKALKSLDLPDYRETEKCKQRLCFEKQEVNADARSDVGSDQVFTSFTAPEDMNTADTSPYSKQKMKRGKGDRKRVRAKGGNKFARPSWYGLNSGCVCTRTCPQNIVGFSQQQMNDIQRLASKLTKDLRSMKEIMIDMLQPEARRATPSRNNINEVRIAVENAIKSEDTAKRVIDTMKRDCNRFCKIVSLAEKEANSVGNTPAKEEPENDAVSRGKKKITFADEGGGRLCDVRFIEDQESLLLDSPIIDPIQDS